MSLIGAGLLAAVSMQLLATILFQFAPLRARFHRLDYVGVLPRWRFFIPDGGTHDHAIAVRRAGGDWRTVWEMPSRGRWSWLWAPDPRDDQNMWFAAATLDARVARGRESSATTSHAHALIAARCRELAGLGEDEFALVRIEADGTRCITMSAPLARA